MDAGARIVGVTFRQVSDEGCVLVGQEQFRFREFAEAEDQRALQRDRRLFGKWQDEFHRRAGGVNLRIDYKCRIRGLTSPARRGVSALPVTFRQLQHQGLWIADSTRADT